MHYSFISNEVITNFYQIDTQDAVNLTAILTPYGTLIWQLSCTGPGHNSDFDQK